MIRRSLSHMRWVWFVTVASMTGLLLTLNRCEQNPIITDLPGSQWEISDTSYSVVDTVLVRTPRNGGSHTLYTGLIDEDEPDPWVSGILVKFASVDSSQLANFRSARLVLFRSTFGNEPLDPEVSFALYTIDEPDTTWTEADTAGHTIMNSLETTLESTAFMSTAPITIPSGDTTIIRTDLEYLEFEVDSTTLSEWREGQVANNGFLIRQEDQGALIGFHSRESNGPSPYLILTFADTTSTGEDTTRTVYRWPTADLSIYSLKPDNSVYADGSLHLDHSSGLRSHLDFGPDFNIDKMAVIADARLTLYRNRDVDVPPIVADQMDIQVLRRTQPLADERDSSVVVFDKLTYSKESDSLVLKLGSFLRALANAETDTTFKYYGLDLVVIPNNHDFDHLVFWGASALDSLKRPRLEIIYSSLYKGVP